jgi:L,D-peptidoglycan transpeptidase YkuD (ErfK/YbiS/YcfS/YnhG family)
VERDWDSNEAMMRHGKLYELGAFIANNPKNVPGDGSCIFMHVWPGPGQGTAGCTAMSVGDLQRVLLWLDPEKHPCLVQGLEGW